MYKTIITPENNSVQLHLPEEFIGKEIEITAYITQPENDKQKLNNRLSSKQKTKLKELQKFYNNYNVDLSNYKFNRDELNK